MNCHLLRLISLLVCLLPPGTTLADQAQEALRLWGSQGGPWQGHIDIYGPDSQEPTTVSLITHWDALPDFSALTKRETFIADDRETSALTVMFAEPDSQIIVTPYFIGGRQRDFRFEVLSVSVTDDSHWEIVIASPGGEEEYEGRPALLRYVRRRSGDTIENTKEVRFLDDRGDSEYQLRSYISQTLSASGEN